LSVPRGLPPRDTFPGPGAEDLAARLHDPPDRETGGTTATTGVEMEPSVVRPAGEQSVATEPSLAGELRSSALLLGLVIGTTSAVAVGAQLLVRVLS